jgi:hypothetical protein
MVRHTTCQSVDVDDDVDDVVRDKTVKPEKKANEKHNCQPHIPLMWQSGKIGKCYSRLSFNHEFQLSLKNLCRLNNNNTSEGVE